MTHKSFKNTVNKLFSLWNQKDKLESQLKNKDTNVRNFFNDKGNIKVNKIIYDSDYIGIKPVNSNLDFNYTNVIDEKMPAVLNFQAGVGNLPFIDLDIPDYLIPFIKTDILVKTTPDAEATSVSLFTVKTWQGDFADVRGDGQLIYHGFLVHQGALDNFQPTGPLQGQLYSQDDITSGRINGNFTKKVFQAEIFWTDGVDSWKTIGNLNGAVIREFGPLEAPSNICKDETTWSATFYQIGSQDDNSDSYGEPLSASGGSMTFTSKEVFKDYVEIAGPACFLNSTTITHNVTKTAALSSALILKYRDASHYKLISGDYVLQSSGNNGDIDTTIVGTSITSVNVIGEVGFWLYYSSDKRWPFYIGDSVPSSFEGQYTKKELKNTPSVASESSVELPYLTIVFKRNFDDHPNQTVETNQIVGSGDRTFLFKLRPNKYRIVPTGDIIIMAPANVVIQNLVPEYNDEYTRTGTAYVNNMNHELKSKDTYSPNKSDVQFRIVISIDNPFYWEEQKKMKVTNG